MRRVLIPVATVAALLVAGCGFRPDAVNAFADTGVNTSAEQNRVSTTKNEAVEKSEINPPGLPLTS